MLGISSSSGMLESSSGDGNTTAAGNLESEMVGHVPDGECREEERGRGGEEGDRNLAGNRWPRQETLALLKIRSDMDVAFRDSTLKAPLWDGVSRKLSELGYHRSSKKCKEKFENVYKYYKRTKEGRSSRQDGKTYRFFDQLEALDNLNQSLLLPPLSPGKNQPSSSAAATVAMVAATATNTTTRNLTTDVVQNNVKSSFQTQKNLSTDLVSTSTASASSSSSGDESEGTRKKKRKMAAFFERLMNEVIEKQESLQKKFLEAIEKREHDRMVREDVWKMQEMERMNREHEILVQERSIAAAKDAAVIAFLQKISEQSNPVQLQENSSPPSSADKAIDIRRSDNGENFRASGENFIFNASSSRWPKAEVQALIKLRTSLDLKYQENGPKGPLWEEISSAMKKIGYDRSSKRCKEKWENINKYFKKVKESNKKRPEDSKTCPYFHQLDALYKEKTKRNVIIDNNSLNPGFGLKAEDIVMQMTNGPDEQPQPLRQEQPRPDSVMEDLESENMDQEGDGDDGDDDDDDDDEEDENEVSGYEIVSNNNPSSMAIAE